MCLETVSPTIRVPEELYEALRQVKLALENEYKSAAPSMQDIATVALRQFINDWKDLDKHEQLLAELLENRTKARTNMGKAKVGDSPP
jgi:hypothetical protein